MAHNCETCAFRKKYDTAPNSILGRLWRWHINFCPGFKRYITSQPEGKRKEIAKIYNLPKYQ
ncbi:MAG: hypothetical protein MI747_14050 [Desulfobacterales bacterium]|nr:hypothetical protein [Desulfobacterales bacterium]